jgi:hypothetical protein
MGYQKMVRQENQALRKKIIAFLKRNTFEEFLFPTHNPFLKRRINGFCMDLRYGLHNDSIYPSSPSCSVKKLMVSLGFVLLHFKRYEIQSWRAAATPP